MKKNGKDTSSRGSLELNPRSPLINNSRRDRKYVPDVAPSGGDDEKRAPSVLANRKRLLELRRKWNDVITIVAMAGLVLVVLVTELRFHNIVRRGSVPVQVRRALCEDTHCTNIETVFPNFAHVFLSKIRQRGTEERSG